MQTAEIEIEMVYISDEVPAVIFLDDRLASYSLSATRHSRASTRGVRDGRLEQLREV